MNMKIFSRINKVLCGAISLYRRAISPLFPPCCRFTPTCSAYAMEAMARYGMLKGSQLAILRLLKCHPFHPGGYDPLS